MTLVERSDVGWMNSKDIWYWVLLEYCYLGRWGEGGALGITIGITQSPWTRLQPLHNSEKVLKTWRDWQMYNCVHIFVYPSVEAIGKCITVCLVWPSVEETRQIYCCVYISAEETLQATAAVQLNERMAPRRRGSRNRGYKPLLWNLPPDIKRFHSEKMSKIQI